MESDSKDGKNGEPVKEEMKGIVASRRSARKKTTTEEKQKEKDSNQHRKSELPSTLLPKFPSQKMVRKRPSRENVAEVVPFCVAEKGVNEEDEKSIEKEKAENYCEDEMMLEDLMKDEEMIIEHLKEVPENAMASPVDQPSVENKKLKTDAQEKPDKLAAGIGEKKGDKPSSRDKNSGRSEDRIKKNRKEISTDEKRSAEDKKKDLMKKKVSAEDPNSDDMKKSTRKSLRKKSKQPVGKQGQQSAPPTQGPQQSIYQQPTLNSGVKTDHSLKLFMMEPKSYDDRGKVPKAKTPHQAAKKEVVVPAQKPIPPNVITVPPSASGADALKSQQTIQEQQMQQQQQLLQKNKRMKFLKNVYQKTKFWGRKSDCVANPSTEMLAKSYVKAEYGKPEFDFTPNPEMSLILTSDEWAQRYRNNHSSEKEIFVNKRPFWLTRLPTDITPKVRIQLHRPLKQMYQGNKSSILPKWRRTEPFCDPLKDPIAMLQAIDTVIGIDQFDPKKEKELNRICANTFHATIMFEAEKLAWDEKQKKADAVGGKPKDGKKDTQKRQGKKEMAQKSSIEESNRMKMKPLKIIIPTDDLRQYNRKHRLLAFPPSSTDPLKRVTWDGKQSKSKMIRKAASPSPSSAPVKSSSSTSLATFTASASSSTSSSAEGRKT